MIRTKLGALALTAALAGQPAWAEDHIIAVPSQGLANAKEVLSAAGEVFAGLGLGDGFALLDAADGAVIEHLSIPDKGRYRLASYVDKDFAGEKRQVQSFLVRFTKSEPVAIEALRTDLPALAASIGDLRSDVERPARVLIIGNATRIDGVDPVFSMIDEEGRIAVPSDGLLAAPLSRSPFGQGPKQAPLKNVSVHFCALLPDGTSHRNQNRLMHVWTHYIALRGGVLATFTPDLRLCLKRYLEGHSTALEVEPLDERAEPAMIRLSASTAVLTAEDHLAISVNRIAELDAALAESEAEKASIVDRTHRLSAALAESESKRRSAEKSLQEIQAAIDQSGTLEGVTTFSRFQHIPHPTLKSRSVTTGVKYERTAFPAYESAWCYINVPNSAGSTVRLHLGEKDRGGEIDWDTPRSSVLADVGFSKRDMEKARESCRFPAE